MLRPKHGRNETAPTPLSLVHGTEDHYWLDIYTQELLAV